MVIWIAPSLGWFWRLLFGRKVCGSVLEQGILQSFRRFFPPASYHSTAAPCSSIAQSRHHIESLVFNLRAPSLTGMTLSEHVTSFLSSHVLLQEFVKPDEWLSTVWVAVWAVGGDQSVCLLVLCNVVLNSGECDMSYIGTVQHVLNCTVQHS